MSRSISVCITTAIADSLPYEITDAGRNAMREFKNEYIERIMMSEGLSMDEFVMRYLDPTGADLVQTRISLSDLYMFCDDERDFAAAWHAARKNDAPVDEAIVQRILRYDWLVHCIIRDFYRSCGVEPRRVSKAVIDAMETGSADVILLRRVTPEAHSALAASLADGYSISEQAPFAIVWKRDALPDMACSVIDDVVCAYCSDMMFVVTDESPEMLPSRSLIVSGDGTEACIVHAPDVVCSDFKRARVAYPKLCPSDPNVYKEVVTMNILRRLD